MAAQSLGDMFRAEISYVIKLNRLTTNGKNTNALLVPQGAAFRLSE